MILTLKRIARRETYTVGHLYVDGIYFCDTIEDRDRDVNRNGILDGAERKVPGETAIPNGTYVITMNVRSPKFSRYPQYAKCKGYLPRLLNVPGFDGILIHIGNTAANSAGCILVGKNTKVGKVLESTATFWALYDRLKAASDRNEDITIKIY